MEQNVLLSVIVIVVLTTVAVISIAKSYKKSYRIEQLELELAGQFSVNEMIYYHSQYQKEMIKETNQNSLIPNFPLWLKRKLDTEEVPDGICNEEEVDTIHEFFGLSYANYLVIPRVVLQSASPVVQNQIVKALNKIEESVGDWQKSRGHYSVRYRDTNNKFAKDDLKDYQRGNRIVNFK